MKRSDWESLNGHKGGVIWFTGLSGSGKTTLSQVAERELFQRGIRSIVIDGDQLRQGLNRDLGYTDHDRKENMRRAAEIAAMFLNAGFVVLVTMISPSVAVRGMIRQRFHSEEYSEIYVKCSLETCERRDPKGLYKKARAGEILDFTGIDSIYEPPLQAELTIDTEHNSMEKCALKLVEFVIQRHNNLGIKESTIINNDYQI
ncbi:adenylyl-sulfate kinase [Paenibacillus prosopidis]|uniref:Adenylyl-sulfate kinase n=1 Tax=Paenibacillus prosopidis TaxID=630520 RepID=A0A368W6E4_9BACL|nr:adenylyl-sulfate kinase [Paenibacillus prosopidis]RCW50912.1 adenylylsulfate kinase [Paenibacillus prosopidis]